MQLYVLYGALAAVGLLALFLGIRLFLIKSDLRHMRQELEKTREESYNRNLRVTISDREVEKLAAEINQNLDHQKELKRETERSRRQLEQSISDIAHDLRTPLTVVKGNLQMLESEPLSEQGREYLKVSSKKAETLKRMVDEFFDDCFGPLEYRSLRFESEELPDVDNFQGNAVVNYTEREVPFTRIIEHKFFEFGKDSETGEPISGTIITREYPATWEKGMEPYYPVNNDRNNAVYEQYHELALEKKNVLFGGRLGLYKYFDMDKVIRASLDAAAGELGK